MVKHKNDARYVKTEKLMVKAATEQLSQKRFTTITQICRQAHILTSTFYRHYHSINEMITSYEQQILLDFDRFIKQSNFNTIEQLFRSCLIFIYQHQEEFKLIFTIDQLTVLLKMLLCLQPIIVRGWRLSPAKLERVYQIYSYEITGIWLIWMKQEHFNIDTMTQRTTESARLTSTAVQRLGSLIAE